MEPVRDEDGKFPTFAWPGGYTIIYITRDAEVLCPDCANLPEAYTTSEKRKAIRAGRDQEEGVPDYTDRDWEIVAVDTYDEGPSLNCANCNKEIESSYGDPDEEEESVVGRKQKINYPITYEANQYGHYRVIDQTTGKDLYFQVDYEFPDLARDFGWNGKILPKSQLRAVNIKDNDTTGAAIYSAIKYLDDNEGKVVEDPGYFDED